MEARKMAKPIVAIVGRPNVGKSTLFNKLVGQRLSIVDDTSGVTRDRIYGECEWQNRTFSLIDTGGIEPYSDDVILSHLFTQTITSFPLFCSMIATSWSVATKPVFTSVTKIITSAESIASCA